MPKRTSAPNPDPPAAEDATPQPAPAPTAPAPPSPVTIQVSPQGIVTISVTPPAPPDPVALDAGFEALTPRGIADFFRGDRQPEEGEPAEEAAPSVVEQALDKLRGALKTLGEKVADFAEDVTTLEVRTFVSDRLDRLDDNFFTTAEPRALTRVDLDGDTDVVVPLNEGQLDEALWRIHADTVAQAQAHREAMLRTVLDLVRGIVPTVK